MTVTATRDIIIQTARFDEAVAFYEHALGMGVFLREATIVGLEAGAFRLFIEPGALPGPVFEFTAADFDATRAALLAAGCVVVEEDASLPRCTYAIRSGWYSIWRALRAEPGRSKIGADAGPHSSMNSIAGCSSIARTAWMNSAAS